MAIGPTTGAKKCPITTEIMKTDMIGVYSHPHQMPPHDRHSLITGQHQGTGRRADRVKGNKQGDTVSPTVIHTVFGNLEGHSRPYSFHNHYVLHEAM